VWFSQIFVIALSGAIVLQWWLNQRQLRHIAINRAAVPTAFADKISLDAHQKAADYTSDQSRNVGTVLNSSIAVHCCYFGRSVVA